LVAVHDFEIYIFTIHNAPISFRWYATSG
jgi:hypothetical protein